MTKEYTLKELHNIVSNISDDRLIEASLDIYDLSQIDMNNIKIYLRTNIANTDNSFTILYITNLYHNCIVKGIVTDNGYEIHDVYDIDITHLLTIIYRHANKTELNKINNLIQLMYPIDQLWTATTTINPINSTEYTKQ